MKNRKGFTLIELMIVIAIIIILAAIAIPNYLKMQQRAKISAIESDMKSISTALEAYNSDWSQYPGVSTWDNLKKELTGDTTATTNISSHTTVTGEAGGIEYISQANLEALEKKVGYTTSNTTPLSYSVDNGKYKLTVTTTISGTKYTFTMTPGGQISVSQS
ncbi:MAG: prepilin-type N-terminal cleavage/methylation domain-containing protein [Conexivisphaerales archaeon]